MKDGRNWRTCSACSNPSRKPFPDRLVDFWSENPKSLRAPEHGARVERGAGR
jgi:hypothetical protein